jgi:hypothetical protein
MAMNMDDEKRLTCAAIEGVAIPATAGAGTVDETVHLIRTGVPRFLEQRMGASKETIGRLQGRSTRWVYEQEVKEINHGTPLGQQIQHAALRLLLERFPHEVTLLECGRWLHQELGLIVEREVLRGLMDLLCEFGYLERGDKGYAARRQVATLDSTQHTNRVGRATRALSNVYPLMVEFTLGQGVLHTFDAKLTPKQLEWLVDANRRSLQANLQHVMDPEFEAESDDQDGNRVHFRAIYVSGVTQEDDP